MNLRKKLIETLAEYYNDPNYIEDLQTYDFKLNKTTYNNYLLAYNPVYND